MFVGVALPGFAGSAIEFHDFLLHGAAASQVFNELFFSGLDPMTGTVSLFLAGACVVSAVQHRQVPRHI
ncbi:hypothetical protein ACFRQM_36935 [Streptomyces sp. NPDC056831]|uniref:hypothetical protein n=1 Tax=Streptomyces sp. NPDC056831 TaxID=3345954 RepID=UPI0036C4ED5F